MEDCKVDPFLKPYRILDLTEDGCMIGGRILGDLGADVIKIEPPGGSPSRIAPYYKNLPDPEKSLYWFAYNMNKRGVTLDINKAEGQKVFKRLVKTADVVIESFDVGVMEQLGIGYNDLCKVKPDIIVTSITPFGQNGPKAYYKGCDLVAWASGGYLYVCGDPDRPPVWISFPQASLHAGAEAASGTMAAIWHRNRTGEGQQVDVSMQECSVSPSFNAPEMWDLNKLEIKRSSKGINIGNKGVRVTVVWPCKDGFVTFIAQGGVDPFVSSIRELARWMASEGMTDDWFDSINWAEDYNASRLVQDKVDRAEKVFAKFFMTKTKNELYEEGALKRRILIAPISTTEDIRNNKQLQSRGFWVNVEHPELNESIIYPGPFAKLNNNPLLFRCRAPLIGEHNSEIYQAGLGMPRNEMEMLKDAGVI
jgi:crotonobetainyl-CoA:carnitine CoA-transferase CaiB-like acyl-CoA transferase